jgi:tRNA pseudouridine55 synthase
MSRRRKGLALHGWLALDKPPGISSAAAVARVRWLTKAQKIGHAGTLDPMATGILPIALGEATKTVPYAMQAEKHYICKVMWGTATDTDDREGALLATGGKVPEIGEIDAALPSFLGTILQTPPRYSALKIAGQRAYDLARAGQEVHLAPRAVCVKSIKRLENTHDQLEIICGKGTYIRALVRDLALRLGTYAHLVELCRKKVGQFSLDSAISLDALATMTQSAASSRADWSSSETQPAYLPCILPITTVLDDIPALALSADAAQRLRQGQVLTWPGPLTGSALLSRSVLEEAHSVLEEGGLEDSDNGEGGQLALALYQLQPVALVTWADGKLKAQRVFNL